MSSSSPQRPGPLPKSGSSRHHHGNDHHQHSKSWTARLYRKHDAKHHQREAAPLLADENPEEPEPSEGESEPEERQRCRSCCSCCSRASKGPSGLLKKAGKHVKDALVKVGEAAKSAGNAVAGAAKKSGSKARDNPKKIMGVTIAVLLAAVVGLGIALVVDKIQHKKEVKVCTSAACVQASDFILRNLDPDLTSEDSTQALDYHTVSLDPCTNFDEFVCGGFDKQYDLREDQGDMYTGKLALLFDGARLIAQVPSWPTMSNHSSSVLLCKMGQSSQTKTFPSTRCSSEPFRPAWTLPRLARLA